VQAACQVRLASATATTIRQAHMMKLPHSKTWHRGGLKFPGAIEMKLQSLHEKNFAMRRYFSFIYLCPWQIR
jgi:hypothetical protein